VRPVVASLALVGVCSGIGFVALQPWARPRLPRAPEHLPAAWLDASASPSGWIFVTPACPHCRDHLQALGTALAELPATERAALAARLHLVGTVPLPGARCPSLRQHPNAWRDSLAIRFTPMTLWVDATGTVREAWLGARPAAAWRRAFTRLDSMPGGV
jgi:hypothetical protein